MEYSEESCETVSSSPISTIYYTTKLKYIQCKDISSGSELRSEILSITSTNPILSIIVLNSKIPALTQNIFNGIKVTNMNIEADVQIVRENAFKNCTVVKLQLSNNRIQKIEDSSFNTDSLTDLLLNNNFLNEVMSDSFAGALKVRYLSLRNNSLLGIQPNSLKDLQSLEEIDLSFNQLNCFPSNLFRTSKYLRKVYLNNNNFKDLQTDLFIENPLLQSLFLQNNYFNSFDGRHLPVSLLQVDLSNNTLTTINASNLIHLDTLILDSNKLTNINDCLLNISRLLQLHLNHNYLGSSLSNKTFEHLKSLSFLELDHNQILNFDFGCVKDLMSLSGLSLAENNITFLDFSNVNLNIQHLNLSHNNVEGISNISSLKNLESVDMSYNNLDRITYEMFEGMQYLKHLYMEHNCIKELQRGCFRDLGQLMELDLGYNKLKSILTGVLNGMHSLTNLALSHNNLNDLDEDIFHSTKNLRNLDFSFNNFTDINVRTILSHNLWLREINVNGNHWSCKDLIEIIRHNRNVLLTSGTIFNVSNVNGIPCNETKDSAREFNYNQYYKDIYLIMNNTMKTSEGVSSKLTVVSVLLVIILLVLVIKSAYGKYSQRIQAARQFVYNKTTSEQDLALS